MARKPSGKVASRSRPLVPRALLRLLDLCQSRGSLPPEPSRLGAVVLEALLEPFVLEGVLGGDALVGVVDEDLAEEGEELLVEVGGRGDDVLLEGRVIRERFCKSRDRGCRNRRKKEGRRVGKVAGRRETAEGKGKKGGGRSKHTGSGFMALTYFFEALEVSLLG